jgi:ribosomal protein S18 acetylase RimI-like enzyme
MIEIRIRRAVKQDIPSLMNCQKQLAFETEGLELDPDKLQKGMMAIFNGAGRGYYSVAEVKNEIAGCYMITYEWSDWRNGWVYWLQSVYVKESFRNSGVFKQMFNELLTEINGNSEIVGLRLYVDKSNVRAQQVYSAMGMDGEHYNVYELMK